MIDELRTMQERTASAPAFCQLVIADAGFSAKSVTTLPKLIEYFRKHASEEVLRSSADRVYRQHTRAHYAFR